MKLENGKLRERLAAEYVLGTMSPRARRRFDTLLKQMPALRRAVTEWESRLLPLAGVLPEIQPPARVWTAIKARIHGNRPPRTAAGFWQNLSFWRMSSFASAALALALIVFISLPGPQGAEALPGRMVVVMNDLQTREPAMTATWEDGKQGERLVRLRVMGHADMAPGTAWEMWMLPGENQKPVSLGLITTHETQIMVVPASLASTLDNAAGLGMSVEPEGGSPTGLPTGPVIYAGKCLKT
jgi:anti-sigma-K factor RskA